MKCTIYCTVIGQEPYKVKVVDNDELAKSFCIRYNSPASQLHNPDIYYHFIRGEEE